MECVAEALGISTILKVDMHLHFGSELEINVAYYPIVEIV
jgi:hypothetical protein